VITESLARLGTTRDKQNCSVSIVWASHRANEFRQNGIIGGNLLPEVILLRIASPETLYPVGGKSRVGKPRSTPHLFAGPMARSFPQSPLFAEDVCVPYLILLRVSPEGNLLPTNFPRIPYFAVWLALDCDERRESRDGRRADRMDGSGEIPWLPTSHTAPDRWRLGNRPVGGTD